MTCPAVMLSPWGRDLEEMEKTTQAIKLPQRIYSKNWETNQWTQTKPIHTRKPVLTSAFQFWLSSKFNIYIYIYIWNSNKKGRIELHP